MIGGIESQLNKRATCEGEPRGLDRVLMADDDDSRVAVAHRFVHNGFVSFGNIGELFLRPGTRGIFKIVLQFTWEQISNRVPAVPRPVGELSRFGEPFVG